MQNYNLNKIITKRSYNSTEISGLLEVDRKTVRRWIKYENLKVIETGVSPILIMGIDLIDFIRNKRKKRKMKTNKDEYICFKCHRVVKAEIGSEQIIKTGKTIGKENHEQLRKTGVCEHCGTKLNKF